MVQQFRLDKFTSFVHCLGKLKNGIHICWITFICLMQNLCSLFNLSGFQIKRAQVNVENAFTWIFFADQFQLIE